MANEDINEGEEFFASYGYSFESGPPWYKRLYLQFIDDHPEEVEAIQKNSNGRTKEELEEYFEAYMKAKVQRAQDEPILTVAPEQQKWFKTNLPYFAKSNFNACVPILIQDSTALPNLIYHAQPITSKILVKFFEKLGMKQQLAWLVLRFSTQSSRHGLTRFRQMIYLLTWAGKEGIWIRQFEKTL